MHTTHAQFAERLGQTLPAERMISDPLRTLAYGTDASFYRLIPQLVVRAESEAEVVTIVNLAAELGIAITFRAAGTSLSGQAITDSVLVQLGDGWDGYSISEQGDLIRLQPGVIGAQANRWLAPYGRRIGPDPASINTAKIGGIAANNASGMCCGTAQNSYRTLASMRLLLADGTLVDTGNPESVAHFRHTHATLLQDLAQLGEEARANAALRARIEHKYRLKNTTGYALNALIDYTDPLEILQHLMIGSEGTLGFIAEISYRTVVEHPHKASALIFFNDLSACCQAVSLLKQTPVSAVELIDRPGLRSIENQTGMPELIRTLPDSAAALLVETRAADMASLSTQIATIKATLTGFDTAEAVEFSTDAQVCARYWAIRKGLFPAVGAVRLTGTTVIIEDVAFPVEHLAAAVSELHEIFTRWNYHEAIIFGHALEGNLHFVFTQSFDHEDELKRYQGLMDDVATLVVGRYQGSLKAEHGTGRNMAPYVEMEWGSEAYELMWRIKTLLDPKNILNPGVILNRDTQVHLKNLKPMPATDPLVDTCIECGFCEPTCPSRDLTLTPRQRIVIQREISSLEHSGKDPERLRELRADYRYQGDDTCAACGLCSTTCPVGINTGDLTRKLRAQRNSRHSKAAAFLARRYHWITAVTRTLLRANQMTTRLLGDERMRKTSDSLRRWSGNRLPQWSPMLPQAGTTIAGGVRCYPGKPHVIYLPSCASRTFAAAATDPDQRSLAQVTESLLLKAGYEVIVPEANDGLCCGLPFNSKGQFAAAKDKADELYQQLWTLSEQGTIPIYSDTSPCSLRLRESLPETLKIYDSVEFIDRFVLANLQIDKVNEPIALHITCSTTRMGLADALLRIVKHCADKVIVPEGITCCGFAGDKGFTTPDLNASALRNLKQAVQGCSEGVSTSRTCEIGLSSHSGIHYHSIVHLLERQARPRPAETG